MLVYSNSLPYGIITIAAYISNTKIISQYQHYVGLKAR